MLQFIQNVTLTIVHFIRRSIKVLMYYFKISWIAKTIKVHVSSYEMQWFLKNLFVKLHIFYKFVLKNLFIPIQNLDSDAKNESGPEISY